MRDVGIGLLKDQLLTRRAKDKEQARAESKKRQSDAVTSSVGLG